VCSRLLTAIEAEPDLMLAALCERLAAERGAQERSRHAVALLQVARDQLQKRVLPSEQDRASWKRYEDRLDPRCLILVDETWAKHVLSACLRAVEGTSMLRTHFLCRRGQRLKAKAPHGHWKRMTSSPRSARPHRRPLRHRRADQRRQLHRVGRTDADPDAQARRHRHPRQSRQP
jgi:hypothetical protein